MTMLALVSSIALLLVAAPRAADAVNLPLPVGGQSTAGAKELARHRNLQRFIEAALALPDPSIRELAARELRSFAVVFVPGILGSQLESPGDGRIWPPDSRRFDTLRLPAALLDERAPSDIKATVLPSWGPMEFYGNALDTMQKALGDLGITTFVPCGYDWRRDIRAGAGDLQRCLAAHGLLDPERTVIFVAHSMGGLVTWTWHDRYYRQPQTPVPRVRALAALGSPLEGACEMLRMMAEGYKQPTETDRAIANTYGARATAAWKAKWEDIENGITATLSHVAVRPMMFTWPGAFELLPPGRRDPTHSCVSEAEPAVPPEIDRPWFVLADRFWEQASPGWFVMNVGQRPAELAKVLAKAREFRAWFRQGERAFPPVPLLVYRSLMWQTPTQLITLNQKPAANGWSKLAGDGRVLGASAELALSEETDTDGRYAVAYLRGTTFVHGALPEDPEVRDDLFAQRIPQIVNAHVALAIARHLTGSDVLLVEHVRRNRQQATLDWNAVFTRLEYRGGTRGAPETEKDRAIVDAYNAALTTRGGLAPEEYASAIKERALVDVKQQAIVKQPAPPEKKLAELRGLAGAYHFAAARFGVVAASPKTSPEHAVFADANRGLVLALAGDYLTAASVLSDVHPRLAGIPDTFDRRDPSRIARLKANVRANLGIALWETGQCAAAKPHLEQARANPRAKERYDRLCHDRAAGRPVEIKTLGTGKP